MNSKHIVTSSSKIRGDSVVPPLSRILLDGLVCLGWGGVGRGVSTSCLEGKGTTDPLEKGMATHCGILAWEISWTEEPGMLYTVHGVTNGWTRLKD